MIDGELYASDAKLVEWYTYGFKIEKRNIKIIIAVSTGITRLPFFLFVLLLAGNC